MDMTKHWHFLDKNIYRKASQYDALMEGLKATLNLIENKAFFCRACKIPRGHFDRILNGEKKPRYGTMVRIFKTLVLQRNHFMYNK